MPQRPKYPLTPEAKETAKTLVQAWDENRIDQLLLFAEEFEDKPIPKFLDRSFGTSDISNTAPPKSILLELSVFGLLTMNIGRDTRSYEIVLLQELRNTVSTDFEVSDYFLTLNAVGTIVYGNLEVKEGAIFQSGASNQGDVNQQSMIQLASDIELKIGELAQTDEALESALETLKLAEDDDKETRRAKLEAVAAQLARVMGYVSDTGGVIGAIGLLAKVMGVM